MLPDPAGARPGQEALAIGADLAPATMLAGYRGGLFPMPDRRRLAWFSPDPRGVLPLAGFHASRSLRRSVRGFSVSIDQSFEAVLASCADPSRSGGQWITSSYRQAYRRLFALGWAHSVEIWRDGRLVGGLLGVEVGGLFCGESMFHSVTDASKAAMWATVAVLATSESASPLFDVQWLTPHLASMGAIAVSRSRYLARLPPALAADPVFRPMLPRPAATFVTG